MAVLSELQHSTPPSGTGGPSLWLFSMACSTARHLQEQAVRHFGYPLDSSYRNSELNAAKGI